LKEKLIIKNFGPIKEIDLDLGRFTILIGEQATGKSTVAKVLAMCRYFSYLIEDLNELNDDPFFEGFKGWGLNESVQNNSYLNYQCSNYSLVAAFVNKPWLNLDTNLMEVVPVFKVHINGRSNNFNRLLNEYKKIRDGFSLNDFSVPFRFFQNDVKSVMDNPFYLPAQRGLQSIFSLGKNSINNLSDSLFNQLARMDQIARMFKTETYIEPLDIYYVNRDGHGFIRKANETEFYSLYNAASGYQSAIPIVLVFKYYTDIRKRKKTFIIEEPEQNLFPLAQNKLMQHLVEKANSIGSSVFLATQSPYILASINNLIYAHNVGQLNAEPVNNIIEKKYWLNPVDVSAYRLLTNGTARNIIDEDLREIIVEELDNAGKQMNDVYDKILDVKFGNIEKSE